MRAERREEGVLDGVAGQLLVVQEAARHGQHPAAQRAHDGGVGVLVARLEAADQVDIGGTVGRSVDGSEHVCSPFCRVITTGPAGWSHASDDR